MIGLILGSWQRIAVYAALASLILSLAELDGYRRGEKKLYEYQAQQATAAVAIVVKRGEIVTKTETIYRDRLKVIYQQGAVVEKEVIKYVTKADDAGCVVPVGFVREFNSAWGAAAGSPAESDRGPSGVPLSAVAEADAFNATACRAYKTQRDGVIEFYRKQQAVK